MVLNRQDRKDNEQSLCVMYQEIINIRVAFRVWSKHLLLKVVRELIVDLKTL